MKRMKRLIFVILVLLCAGFVTYNWQDISYGWQFHTDAERTVFAYAQENGYRYSDYPQELIALLERNPEAEQYVLEYPEWADREQTVDLSDYDGSEGIPLFMQWDRRWGYRTYGDGFAGLTACGPVCLSMVAYGLTGDDTYAPHRMIEYAEENGYYYSGKGSKWTLISQGAVELGFDVTELPLVKQRIMDNLAAGNPIICVMGPGDFTSTGHFIVMVGTTDGMIRVNDPNSYANSGKLWVYEDIADQIRNLWVIRMHGE